MAGGWALDIHVGHQTREHADIDVAIYRKDQQVLYHYLKEDWVLYKAQQGVLKHWHEGEHLTSTNDVWVSKRERSPWAFQVMLMDSTAED